MHVFLTGVSGVGKSTALDRTLSLLGLRPGGFRTGFTPDRKRLCLWPAWQAPDWSENSTVARMERGRLIGDPAAFDRLGPAVLQACRPWARLLVLDELGWLEQDAAAFRNAVWCSVRGEIPILGVIKPIQNRAGTWLEELAQAPDGWVVTVGMTNRDALPGRLAAWLRSGSRYGEKTGEGWERA